MNELKPIPEEIELAKWLQTLFDFETDISYYIYDYGKRYCAITIEAANEPYPMFHTNDASLDWQRGENSIVVAKFAREQLPKGENEWYCARKGFTIPVDKLKILKDKMA
jgi:hypothetical protein